MKTKHLIIVAFAVFGFFITGCNEADEWVEPAKLSQPADEASSYQVYQRNVPDNGLENNDSSLTEDIVLDLKLPVAIRHFPCYNGGSTLIVHNPKSGNLELFSGDAFEINWYRDGKYMASHEYMLDCVIDGEYMVSVKNTTNGAYGAVTVTLDTVEEIVSGSN